MSKTIGLLVEEKPVKKPVKQENDGKKTRKEA